jgi:hypothetical protein
VNRGLPGGRRPGARIIPSRGIPGSRGEKISFLLLRSESTTVADMSEVFPLSSPDAWVMLQPRSAFTTLARQPVRDGIWLAVRRPLLLAFVIGCTISLLTSAGLTLRLTGGATIYWSFVPLAEIVALGATSLRNSEGVSRTRAIDLFFTGHGPWCLWLIGLGAIWSFFPPARAFELTSPLWLYGTTSVVVVWSVWIDFCFFRVVIGRSRSSVWSGLLLQRLISWSLVIAIFGAPAILPDLAGRLKL